MLTFAHLSDMHILPPGRAYNGLDSATRFEAVLAAVARLETPPLFMLLTGDLIDQIECDTSYARLQGLLAGVHVPLIYALGNHDERAPFRKAFGTQLAHFLAIPGDAGDAGAAPCHGVQLIGDLRVIVLDTVVPGFTKGAIDEAQLAWLEAQLNMPFSGRTLIALHHCPLPVPTVRFQQHQLTNADALARVIAPHAAKISGMLHGHIHYANSGRFAGVYCSSAPGIAMGIAPDAQQGLRLTDACGFNLCHLFGDQLVVNSVITHAESRTLKYDKVMAWQ
jgi:3',5'-cyclic AMP phosphodiesterase CpdA